MHNSSISIRLLISLVYKVENGCFFDTGFKGEILRIVRVVNQLKSRELC